jgi:hypothetical protein
MHVQSAFRDGIFSTSRPRAAFASHNMSAYSDGALGRMGSLSDLFRGGLITPRPPPKFHGAAGLGMDQPRSFRDGLFSSTMPRARFEQMLTSYADGVLGQEDDSTATAQKKKLLVAGGIAIAGIALVTALVVKARR